MPFTLLQLSNSDLEALAGLQVPRGLEERVEKDALPPDFVASGALELAAAGYPAPWSTTFLIVRDEDQRIIGSCGFKTAPKNGSVEVGYGVSPQAQSKGAATAALNLLVDKAFEAGATEVVAEVGTANHASTRVVQKLGFQRIGTRVDEENEHVVQWAKRRAA